MTDSERERRMRELQDMIRPLEHGEQVTEEQFEAGANVIGAYVAEVLTERSINLQDVEPLGYRAYGDRLRVLARDGSLIVEIPARALVGEVGNA